MAAYISVVRSIKNKSTYKKANPLDVCQKQVQIQPGTRYT